MIKNKKYSNDILYFCSLIEYTARKTNNHVRDIIQKMDINDIHVELNDAEVNHCASFEEISSELIEKFQITMGDFDIKSNYTKIPSYIAIGSVYRNIIVAIADEDSVEETIKEVLSSFLIDEISNYDSDVYYQNTSYLLESLFAGKLLP